jgi:hypothetical protein
MLFAISAFIAVIFLLWRFTVPTGMSIFIGVGVEVPSWWRATPSSFVWIAFLTSILIVAGIGYSAWKFAFK